MARAPAAAVARRRTMRDITVASSSRAIHGAAVAAAPPASAVFRVNRVIKCPVLLEFQLVPRTRSSHDFSARTVANFGFKSGTRIIELLVSFSIPKFAEWLLRALANFGIGTLAGKAQSLPQRPAQD